MRTSGSPLVTEAKDFSTCLLAAMPEHIGVRANVWFHIATEDYEALPARRRLPSDG